jgi:hypothetical protein
VTHVEALRLAVHVIHCKEFSLVGVGSPRSSYAGRLREAAEILDRLAPYYVPGSDAWK